MTDKTQAKAELEKAQFMERAKDKLRRHPGLVNILKDFVIATDMMNSRDSEVAERGKQYQYWLCCSLQLVGLPADIKRVNELLQMREEVE